MNGQILTQLQLREVFHLEFLRWFNKKVDARFYAIKGGSNMRFFFKSIRYSEDMDIDIVKIGVHKLKEVVIGILENKDFQNGLRPFGIDDIVAPDMTKAKQTQTTQRFKIHLSIVSGEDLFTKIEFSRRGFSGNVVVQPVLETALRTYKMPPLLVPHYDIHSTVVQKILAISSRSVIQARDVFDLFILSSQYVDVDAKNYNIDTKLFDKAYENVFEIGFDRFRDTVVSYLSLEDQVMYNSSAVWDEIKIRVANFIEGLKEKYGK